MANIEENIPVTPQTLFLVGSVSKPVTATALMQLYDQGKFQLDDDINDYLPFKVHVPAYPQSSITFRQLLNHTSSIKDNKSYINCPEKCDYGASLIPFVTRGADSPISLADFTKGYLQKDGAYYEENKNFEFGAPGTINEYSNMGIVVAGYLVEVISGKQFYRYCHDRIFAPLDMHKSSWKLAGIDYSILAVPYDKSKSGYVPYGHYGEPDYPDGMLRTSVVELANFLATYMQDGLYNHQQVLKSSTVRDMLKPQTSLDKSQGLVWYRDSIKGKTVWGHDGSDNGACAGMWFDPEENEGVIVMANGACHKERRLIARLFREADEY